MAKASLTHPCVLTISCASIAALFILALPQAAKADPFQLGAEERNWVDNPAPPGYGGPQMMPTGTNNTTLQGNTSASTRPTPRPAQRPLQASAQVTLPPAFMGAWLVQGNRKEVKANTPDFQATANSAFAQSTRNIWNIQGNANNYSLTTDQGVTTQLHIWKVAGNRAFIRYQHPIGKTMAQEAIVMELGGNGASFSGLERISIIKEGEKAPRAQVTYGLSGTRQQ